MVTDLNLRWVQMEVEKYMTDYAVLAMDQCLRYGNGKDIYGFVKNYLHDKK